MPLTLDDMRRFSVARSLFSPTSLKRALDKFGFVQADPIRAPARAQDLMLRHRVKNYRAGDLERNYAKLGVEEDFFINYGFVTRQLQALMHPRPHRLVPAQGAVPVTTRKRKKAELLLEFVRERGTVHPREVDAHFAHGRVENYWGGSSNATTHLLDLMHYQGLLRVARRENGIRLYAAHQHGLAPADKAERHARLDALADVAIGIYAPLPGKSLALVLRRLRYAVPQWNKELAATIQRAKHRLQHEQIDGMDWYWPEDENPARAAARDEVRLLAPFDPVVWERFRFERLWGWAYRFEAYTPVAKRVRGYYALPLLWRENVIGWANLTVVEGRLKADMGYVAGRSPNDAAFRKALEAELERMRVFLGLEA